MVRCICTNRIDSMFNGLPFMKNNNLNDHLNKIISRQKSYQDEILSLPKGKIVLRKVSNNHYLYLLYRDHSKVRNSYLGPAETANVEALQVKIDRRNYLKKALKYLVLK